MLSKLYIAYVILTLVNACIGAVYFEYNKVSENGNEFESKEGCYSDITKSTIPYGKTETPLGNCVRIYCSKQMMEIATCGSIGTSDTNCSLTKADTRFPYPECCPTIICDPTNDV